MNLSDHFTLAEMTISAQGERAGLDNTPGPIEVANLQRVCRLLEDIRVYLQYPIVILSGYRSAPVNRLVGGSKTSAHMDGLAADFICPRYGTPLEVCRLIAMERKFDYDQLIHEHAWVHVGLRNDDKPNRRMNLTKGRSGGYIDGLVGG